jgi:hypothetical protein
MRKAKVGKYVVSTFITFAFSKPGIDQLWQQECKQAVMLKTAAA